MSGRAPDPSCVNSSDRRAWHPFGSADSFGWLLDFRSQRNSVVATRCAAVEDGRGLAKLPLLCQCGLEVAKGICGTVFPVEFKNTSSGVDGYQRKGCI